MPANFLVAGHEKLVRTNRQTTDVSCWCSC